LEAAIPWKLIDDAPWCRIYVVLERGAMNKNGRDDTSMADTLTQQYFAGLSKNTFLLACASLFADISTEMLYPVLPVFLTQTLNAGGSAVGLIDGVAQATQNIAQAFPVGCPTSCKRENPLRSPVICWQQSPNR
jgi:hypothetical protein